MKNIFQEEGVNEVINRINKLSANSKPEWGSMNAGQMLAHCNVAYDLDFLEDQPKAKGLKKFMLKLFLKSLVVGEKPYSKNSRTSPDFLIADEREFDVEKSKLVTNMHKVQKLGESHYDGRESNSFGELTAKEWNNMYFKHLDHQLKQFGV